MKQTISMLMLSSLASTFMLTATPVLAQKQFTDPAGGFSYTVPKDWQTKTVHGTKYQVLITAASNKFAPNLNFINDEFSDSLLAYLKVNKQGIAGAFVGAATIGETQFESANLGTVFVLAIKRSEKTVKLIQTFYFYDQKNNKNKWVATCSRLSTQPASIDKACLSIIKSLKFAK
jgi:hypothetical protein